MTLTHSFEDLAQTFRVLVEAHFKFGQLIAVDRSEAIGNIETSVNAMLNSFANLYDLMQQELGSPVDWYATPELCLILAIRNARHHNNANRIRSIYNYHIQHSDQPTEVKEYFYVDFPANPEGDGGQFFDIPISWGDISTLLDMPRNQSRLRATAKGLVRNYINADSFEEKANENGKNIDEIFINFVPLATNAGIALFPYIKDYVNPDSTESKYFLGHFELVNPAFTNNPNTGVIKFNLPE